MANVERAPAELMDKIGSHFGGLPTVETTTNRPQQEDEVLETGPETAEGDPVEQEVQDDGFDDLDWEGESYRVPKGLKEAVMRTEDYTKKTQELAEQRRAVDQVKELAETSRVETAFVQSIAAEQQEINIIDAYLKQVTATDWTQMSGDALFKFKIELDNIKERRQGLVNSIQDKRNRFTSDLQSKIKDLRAKAREIASKSINGFSEDTEKTIREYAKSEGLNDSEIDNVLLDPRSFKVIWKAAQYDKIKAGTSQAADKAAKADRVLKPGVAGNRMPKETMNKLNFGKALAKAETSSQKARVIEDRLSQVFTKGKR
jgi:hypothetical protein